MLPTNIVQLGATKTYIFQIAKQCCPRKLFHKSGKKKYRFENLKERTMICGGMPMEIAGKRRWAAHFVPKSLKILLLCQHTLIRSFIDRQHYPEIKKFQRESVINMTYEISFWTNDNIVIICPRTNCKFLQKWGNYTSELQRRIYKKHTTILQKMADSIDSIDKHTRRHTYSTMCALTQNN